MFCRPERGVLYCHVACFCTWQVVVKDLLRTGIDVFMLRAGARGKSWLWTCCRRNRRVHVACWCTWQVVVMDVLRAGIDVLMLRAGARGKSWLWTCCGQE